MSAIINPVEYLKFRAEKNPDSNFLYTEERITSNLETYENVRKIASYFRQIGVKPGDVIALNMPSPLHIVFMLATWHEAGISAPYSPSINNQLKIWKPDWLFSTEEYPKDAARKVVKIDQKVYIEIESLNPADDHKNYQSINDYVRILFSSGTTGVPKGVPLSMQVLEKRAAVRRELWLNSGSFLSLFDIGSLGGFGTFHGQLISGAAYVPPANLTRNARNILKLKIEHIQGSPNQISALADLAERHEYRFDSLKQVTVAGASMTPFMLDRIEKNLKAHVQNLYASTEGGIISYRTDTSKDPNDLGNIIPRVSVQIVDEFDSVVEEGVIGKIRVKSSETASEYFKDKEASRKFFKDGWFYPGDLGYISSEGRLFLEGRSDELVNIGGLKIDPMKVDNFIDGKFGIIDAGSFGFKENDKEYFVLALVSHGLINEIEILDSLRNQFGASSPSNLFQVDQIPRNERGKVDRSKLINDFKRIWKN